MAEICGNCFAEEVSAEGICLSCGFASRKSLEAHPLALPPGTILYGRYIVGKVLGQGGFGITYLAQDYPTKTNVAIKEFFPDTMVTRNGRTTVAPFSGDRGEHFTYGKNTFLNEAKTMAEFIGNKNVVQVHSYFEENNTGYFVMEYVEGTSLQEYVKQFFGRISWDEALGIILPIMDALSAVHDKGIIHRDVTPDNIYIQKDGTVKLLDFGAARHSLGNVSRSLDVILKHGFAPKEQYHRHGRQGPYTDVYAVAATLYYLITGTRPDDAIERLEEDNLPLPSTLGAQITMHQENVLLKGLAVRAEDRYQSMREFSAVLRESFDPVVIPVPVAISGPAASPVQQAPAIQVSEPSRSGFSMGDAVATVVATQVKDVQAAAAAANPGPQTVEQPKLTANTAAAAAVTDMGSGSTAPQKKKTGLIAGICGAVLVLALAAFWLLHPHQFGDWQVVQAPTCSEAGRQIRKCFCGKKEEESLAMLEHILARDAAVPSTCTSTGLTEGSHCSDCGKVLAEQRVTEKLEHTVEKIEAVPATCTSTGLSECVGCINCGYMAVEPTVIPALSHTPVTDGAVAASCTKEGLTEGSHCSVCGEVLEQQEAVPMVDHTPTTVPAVAATCSANGKTEGSKCSVCDKILTEQKSTDKLSHTPTTVPAVAATCSSTGKTEGSKCSVCGEVLKKQETIAKKAHTPVKISAVAATCTEAGLTEGSKCSVCGEVIKEQTKSGSALGHAFADNRCGRCGVVHWYADVWTAKSSYKVGEYVEVKYALYTNEPGATVGFRYTYYYEYDDGDTYYGEKEYSGNWHGGTTGDIYWENGLNRACKVTVTLYTMDGYYLGETSFRVTD